MQGVLHLTDCLVEGVITEEVYVSRMLADVRLYRAHLMEIIRAEKEGKREMDY